MSEGWIVRDWVDVSRPPKWPVVWEVDADGILYGTGRYAPGTTGDRWIGTWLLSEEEYGDFILELEFRFKNGGATGNGGVALRTPLHGDPAYNGLELQITDPRFEYSYFPNATAAQMSGALYLVSPAKKDAYLAGDWNRYRIEMRGPHVKVWLNGQVVQDVDLSTLKAPAKRHGEGEELLDATPGADRPLRGHIGLQDLSESGEVIMFRNVRIARLDTVTDSMADEPQNLLTAADLADFANPPADARIPYGDDPLQFGDLRLPPGDGPHPVAIFLHGGCWFSEYDITHSSKLTAALAANGIATWSLEYRRIGDPGGGWPGTFEDVARGADHLVSIAEQYRLDLDRVVTMGHSAGGQLALWLAARRNLPPDAALPAAPRIEVRGVLALAPAADFDYLYEHGTCERAVARLMGGGPGEFPERYRLADPVRFTPGPAPQVILVGRHDETWTPPARRYFGIAEARGDDASLVEAPDSGHFELIDPDSSTWPLVLRAARELLAARR